MQFPIARPTEGVGEGPSNMRSNSCGRGALGVAVVGVGATTLAACGGGGELLSADDRNAAPSAIAQPVPASRAPAVAAADWPSYNRTLESDRFSPLAEIDRGNVAQLTVACTY